MPACMAFFTGVVNAVELITATAIPFAFEEMAALVALTISGTLEFCEPVQAGLGIPSSAAASARPYWVGTKNGLVVTWLTKVNFHGGVVGKFPAADLRGAGAAAAAGRGAGGEQRRGGRGRAHQASAREQLPAGRPVLHVERLDCLIDLGVDFSHRGLQSHSLLIRNASGTAGLQRS